jgi:hypothetical protein
MCALVLTLLVHAAHGSADGAAAVPSARFVTNLNLELPADAATTPPRHPALHPAPSVPDSAGLVRDTQYFLGYQFAVLGVLYVMPEGISGWSSEQKEQRKVDKWWNNVRSPTWDKDKHYLNYIAHPYWGAAYYVRAQERGYDRAAAFWYSVLLSSLFELGAEAIFEQPSIQDLVVTPVFGSLLGIHFMEWRGQTRARVVANGQMRFRHRAVFATTDPLGAVNRLVDQVIGRDVDVLVAPFIVQPSAFQPGHTEPAFGVRLYIRW